MKSAFEEDSTIRMNFYKHMQNRRRRKLPYVQRSAGQLHTFWPTFRGALVWMRKNQDTVNTAIGLLDIYPNLIQDTSMDVFWEFLKPFVVDGDTGRTRKISGPTVDATKTKKSTLLSSTKVVPTVPTISVTINTEEDADDIIKDSDFTQRKTRVYVSGQTPSRYMSTPFSKLTTELKSEYSVHTVVPSNCHATKMCDALANCDVLVFLMSQESVSNPSTYRDLSAAWSMDIPTLCVIPPGFRLPSPLPDGALAHSLDSRTRASHRRHWADNLLTKSVTPSIGSSAKHGRKDNNNSVLPRIRPSSAREYSWDKKQHLVHRDSCDLVLMLIQGYRDAVAWNPINHEESFDLVKHRIEGLVTKLYCTSATPVSSSLSGTSHPTFAAGDTATRGGVKQTKTRFLDVPAIAMYSPLNQSLGDLHSVSDDDDVHLSTHLPPLDQSSRAHSVSDPEDLANSAEKETFYVVFKDRHSPGNIVKWPPTDTENDLGDLFSDSPLSFRDVDLTLEMRPESDLDSSTGGY